MVMIWVAAGSAAALTLLAEALHALRMRRIAKLAFGPAERAAHWTKSVPYLRSAAAGLLAWGLLTLLFEIDPKAVWNR